MVQERLLLICQVVNFLIVLMLFTPFTIFAQFAGGGPQSGDIYKEYYLNIANDNVSWRVTDPNATNPGSPGNSPADFLPNPKLPITIDDLAGAVRAEVVLDLWGGHVGTTGKRIRFNESNWITVPELSTTPTDGQCYTQQVNILLSVPLSDLSTGINYIEGTSGGQTCYGFDWGQWGWYGVIVRIYYNSGKPHATGQITSPSTGNSFNDNPTITLSTSGSVNRIDVLARYDDYDRDGDGIYYDWVRDYHRTSWSNQIGINHHVGTITSAPYALTWNTDWVPDQTAGAISFVARIRDNNGTWYVTNVVQNLTLQRSDFSVKLYKPQNVAENFWVRDGAAKSSTVNVPNLTDAQDAAVHVRTWNGRESGASYYTRVNDYYLPPYGMDHFYSYDLVPMPATELNVGNNTITFQSSTTHHGIEILWPGPAVVVRYGSAPSGSAPVITQHPANQTVDAGETATFSVGATGTPPLSYQWRKNGGDISGANGSSYTTPPTSSADNGSVYSCIVTNQYGSITSNNATLTVNSEEVAPSIILQPTDRFLLAGQIATFSLVAQGTAPLNYQWKKNGINIPGANGSFYTTPVVNSADNGTTYSCFVSNAYGNVTSSSAELIVLDDGFTTNVIQNPSFENGKTSWNFYTNTQGSFEDVIPGYEAQKSAYIQIVSGGSNIQLYQYNIPLQPNALYQLRFSGYSSTGHDLKVTLQKHTTPNTNYGLDYEHVDLLNNWGYYTVEFTTVNFSESVNDARLLFWLADDAVSGDEYFIDNIILTRLDTTNAPEITSTPVTSALEDALYNYQVTAQDLDPDDVLTYQLTIAPHWLGINSSNGLISGTPQNEDVGDTTVTVQVVDKRGKKDTQTYALTVNNVNDDPVIISSPDTTGLQDEPYAYQVIVEDVDVGDVMTYSLPTAPAWLSVSVSGLINGTPGNSDVGNHTVTVGVSDGHGGEDSQTYILRVSDVNAPPVINIALPTLRFNEDQSFPYMIKNWYPYVQDQDDGDEELTYEVKQGTNVWAEKVNNTFVFHSPPHWYGKDTLTLRVSDGELSDSSDFGIEVQSVNDIPIFSFEDTLSFENTSNLVLQMPDHVTDADNSFEELTLSFGVSNSQIVYTYNETTSELTLQAPGYTGSGKLYCRAEDILSAVGFDTVNIKVFTLSDITNPSSILPDRFVLEQNYPNPFNPETHIRFGIPEAGEVILEVYNSLGERIAIIDTGYKAAGYHDVLFEAHHLPSGVYFYRIRINSFSQVKKMLLMK
jgi:hypothetical protein